MDDYRCIYCKWSPEEVESHIEYSHGGYFSKGCEKMAREYDIWRDDNGRLRWKKKENMKFNKCANCKEIYKVKYDFLHTFCQGCVKVKYVMKPKN